MAMTVDGTNRLTFPNSSVQLKAAFSNQTWQDMSGSRAMGTTYTNSTGRVIFVSVSGQGGGQYAYTIVINGSTMAQEGSNAGCYMSATIPDGATYSFTNSGGTGFIYWWELR